MLRKIKIQNLALVETSELEFAPGFSVLTGETGAGKSIIVTALSLALGERAEREYIRHGADRCVVEVRFDVSRAPAEYRKEFADHFENNELVVAREISRDGSSRAKINNRTASVGQLKAVTMPIAEILGQHANQMLMNEDNHLDFLDNFAGLDEVKQQVHAAYHEWKTTADKLREVVSHRDQLTRERELLLFQKEEIARANISVGEEERLLAERRILDSARALMASASMVQDILDGEENSVSSLLSLAQKELDKMSGIDPELEKKVSELVEVSYRLEDLRAFVEQYGASIADDPRRIEEINLRLDEIYGLKKKYGGSEQAVLDALDGICSRLSTSLPDIGAYIDDLTVKTGRLFDRYADQALALTDTRTKAAAYLKKLVVKELVELAIDHSRFDFEFVYEDDPNGVIINGRAVRPTPNGLETGRMMFSANPGEPLKSLVKTASGGEMSRVLLALKSAERKNHKLRHSLLVFDEVDSGIGGQTAIEVGRKLKKLSEDNQLLVITHLHQIARECDHHYVAQKRAGKDKRATIQVRRLEASEVDKELARMVALPE